MLAEFKTVQQYGSTEIVIRRSRFIGHAISIASEQEAIAFIERIKKENSTATHNCSAYIFGESDEFQKQSDDGEPSGTAGKPILEVIKHQGLKNIAVVVTRYFGGIMLGAGGLIRAYTDGAVAGIDAACPIRQVLHQEVWVHIDYTWLGKIENELRNRQILMGETQFTDKVIVSCLPFYTDKDTFVAWMTDLTQGQALIDLGDALYKEHPITKG
ncbi:YigZ family protein [Paenibacillus psychroresistens]|uniref:YigZ family protein n=1 Tax=Paenibacillus psychroresistens TaxID=1778678 RepID=A0A6B8RPE9_9BACL|nr:YigZ family protein [Paenibacillus psychroresistens]QGQ98220.1 YigZ family protein [Paenibacillus psychroresistens]